MGTSSPHRKPYERLTVVLTSADRAALEALLRGGTAPVRTIKRARVLQLLDQGWTTAEVREAVGVCHDTVLAVGHRYRDGGLGRALYEAPRPGGTRVLDDAAAARIIALACGPPPAGFARWTVRLLTDHAPRQAGIPPVGHETLRQVLAHHDLKPWREKMWCVPARTPAYLACMEDVLATYERPYDPREPVVGVDEKPVPLVADVRPPQPGRPGRVARYDYEYSRGGCANVYAAVEPKAGRHFTCATPNRKAPAFAHLLRDLARAYPRARTIHLVVDQLNVHTRWSLARTFGLAAGTRLWNRFTVHYTPVHGSWLNVAECEVSMVARECIGRRIGDFTTLATRVAAWNADANRRRRTIDWRFTRRKARAKFGYSIRDIQRSGD